MCALKFYEKNGKHVRKARPDEAPKPLLNGEGASLSNGIPVLPKLDDTLRKRKRR